MNLTREQHIKAARLLIQAQEHLDAVAKMVDRAAFTDDTLRVQKALQERLIDKLSTAWDEKTGGDRTNPYPSIGYFVQ